MATDEEKRAREAALEQLRFRTANERLRRVVATYRFEPEDRAPFICECADPDCFEVVMVSVEEYDRVRANPSWFVLVAGHEGDEETQERVLEAEHGYVIVEKVGAAEEAERRS